jgi:hypothetical protein
MKKTMLFGGLASLTLICASAVSVLGQEKQPAPTTSVIVRTEGFRVDSQAPASVDFTWAISEFGFDGKLVKGAPYSAQAVTESTQTLSDGNRIVNKSTSALYRDSEGRTRREQTLRTIGNLAGGEPMQTVMISDPVANVSYTLDPNGHTARKMQVHRVEYTPMTSKVSGDESSLSKVFQMTTGSGGDSNVMFSSGVSVSGTMRIKQESRDNVAKETLGKQMIEGVEAEGTRNTITIAAGAIGNDLPIQIVDEQWYSPALQLTVMTRHTDPRFGETVYRLTNIDRSEPSHALFEPPADYTIKEGPSMAPMPMRTRKPMDQ